MQNPWRGLASYEDPINSHNENYQFCGRTKASIEVTNLIQENLFITLYGKSGIGKTSLLKAGVFPKLRNMSFLPIALRLNNVANELEFSQYAISQLEAVLNEFGVAITLVGANSPIDDWSDKDCLWRYFASRRFLKDEEEIYPVLVFDQFEEALFRENEKAVRFLTQLYSLIDDNHIIDPDSYHADTNFRIVVSIREDDLYILEDAIDCSNLSEFKFNRYRLGGMSYEEAKDVILIPGQNIIDKNDEDQIVDKIIALAKRNNNGGINTLILSLICSVIYDKASNAGGIITRGIVNAVDDNVLGDFYTKTIVLSKHQRQFIEKYMIDESGRRNSVTEELFRNNMQDCPELFEGTNRIFYCTIDANGTDRKVELVHDLLAQSIFALKNSRNKKRFDKLGKLSIIAALLVLSVITFKFGFMKDPYPFVEPNSPWRVNNVTELETLTLNRGTSAKNCPKLKSLRFENFDSGTVYSIFNCPSLVDLSFNENNKYFTLEIENCPNLAPIVLSSNVKEIVIHSNEHLTFDTADNENFIWDGKCLWDIVNGTIVYIQPEVREIPGFVFPKQIQKDTASFEKHCFHNLRGKPLKDLLVFDEDSTSITGFKNWIDELDLDFSGLHSVKYIETNAFYSHKNIKSIIAFPPNIAWIGNYAFAENSSLEKINLNSLTNLRLCKGAFKACSDLDSVALNCELYNSYFNNTLYNNGIFDCCGHIQFEIDTTLCKNAKLSTDNIVYVSGGPSFFNMSEYGTRYGKEFVVISWMGDLLAQNDPTCYYYKNAIFAKEGQILLKDKIQSIWFPPFCWFSGDVSVNDLKLLESVQEIHLPYFHPYFSSIPFNIDIPEEMKHNINLYVPYGCKNNYDMIPSYMGFKSIKEDSLFHKISDIFIHNFVKVRGFMDDNSWLWAVALLGVILVGVFFFIVTYFGKKTNNRYKVLLSILEALLMMFLAIFAWLVIYWFMFLICFANISDIWNCILSNITAVLFTVIILALLLNNYFAVIKEKGIRRIIKEALAVVKKWMITITTGIKKCWSSSVGFLKSCLLHTKCVFMFIACFIKRRYKEILALILIILLCYGAVCKHNADKERHELWKSQITELREKSTSRDSVLAVIHTMKKKTNRLLYPFYHKEISAIFDSLKTDTCRIIAQCPLDSNSLQNIIHIDVSAGKYVFYSTRDTSEKVHSYIWNWEQNHIIDLDRFYYAALFGADSIGLCSGRTAYFFDINSNTIVDSCSVCYLYNGNTGLPHIHISRGKVFYMQRKQWKWDLYAYSIPKNTIKKYGMDDCYSCYMNEHISNTSDYFILNSNEIFDIKKDSVTFRSRHRFHGHYYSFIDEKFLLCDTLVLDIQQDSIIWSYPKADRILAHDNDFIALERNSYGGLILYSYKEQREICTLSLPLLCFYKLKPWVWYDISGDYIVTWNNKQIMVLDPWDRDLSERYKSIVLSPEERRKYRLD